MKLGETLGWVMLPVIAVLAAGLLTAAARRLAPLLGLVDKPDGVRKAHARPTPLLGGVAIYLALLLTIAVNTLLPASWDLTPRGMLFSMLLLSSGLFCLLGLLDDRWPMRARHKFLLQILAALPFAVWGPAIQWIALFGMRIDLGPLAIPFTVFWLVSCANVVNLIDGLDGLASTVGLIACVALASVSLIGGGAATTGLAIAFAACLVGFLWHNWPPAKIFLGDSGSLMIGFFIGAISIASSLKTATGIILAFPVVLLSIPILDTLLAIVRRKLMGRNIGEPDRGHIHHLLLDRGLSRLQTLLAIATLCSVMAGAVVASAWIGSDLTAVVACLTVVGFVVAARWFGVHEISLAFRHLEAFQHVLSDAVHGFESRVFLVRHASSKTMDNSSLWKSMLQRVKSAGGARLRLYCEETESGRILLDLNWLSDEPPSAGEPWLVQYAIPRGKGLLAKVVASGQQSPRGGARKVDQLLHSVAHFCRNWPLPQLEHVESDILTFQAPSAKATSDVEPATSTRRAA